MISTILLALSLNPLPGAAQQDPPVDPWQFPTLTDSKPFQRWWWAFQQRVYPLAEIPGGAKTRALQEIEQSKASFAQDSDAWINIGPAPINGLFGGSSGRVQAIAVDPFDLTHWLIAAAQGGIWETYDAGASWSPKTDSQASLAVSAIAFAPSNPKIVYAGTGGAPFSGDSYAGAGLLKSIDGGANWELFASSTFSKTAFSDIKVHPTNPNVLLAATTRAFTGRSSGFSPSPPQTGIFKSADAGMTWSLKLSGNATDVEIDPRNFNNQYAGIGDPFGSTANGVYRATDGGETWTLINGPWSGFAAGAGRVELAISPANSNTLYVSIQDRFGIPQMGNDGGLLGIWRTDNAWAPTPVWTQLPSPSGTGNQLWYDHDIIVDPANSNVVYLGATPLFKFNGYTWSNVNGIHVDQHVMAFAGNRLIVGNGGGVWSTVNGGSTWNNHNTNLSIAQFYDGSIHPTNPNFAFGGSQDSGTEKWTGANAWQSVPFSEGDGAASAISSSNPNNNWAVSFQYLQIIRTINGGASFTITNTPESGDSLKIAPFIARFEKCPANDDVFIAGTDHVWRSNNFFSAVSPFWFNNLSGDFSAGISAVAFAPADSSCNTYAFGTNDGLLRLTTNGGTTWTDIDTNNGVPNRAITHLAFDPTNANVLYVTLSGFDEGTPGQPGHLFKSTNALSPSPAWFNMSPPVNIPHNTIVVASVDPNIVYAGTDLGIWKSTTAGASWIHMGPETGMPNIAVFALKRNDKTGRLVAFTHGRGAFVLVSVTPVIAVSASSYDFGNVNVGDSADTNFTVQNIGGGTLSGNASTNAPYRIISGGSYNLTAGQSQTVTLRFSPTSAGTFMGNVIFTGGSGRSATVSGVGVDTIPPDTSITNGPTGTITVSSATFNWNGTDNVTPLANLVYAYRLDPIEPTFSAFGSVTTKSYSNLANGNYTFYVKAKDQAGNEDLTPASQAFTVNVDTTPPDTSITATPLTLTNSTSASFNFTATKANSTFACKLDAGSFAACTSPQSYSSLTGGSHTFQVQATDQAGNTDPTPASFTWTIDTTAPDTSITSGPTGTIIVNSPTFTWAGTDNVTPLANLVYAYRLDPIEPTFSAFGSVTTKSYSNLTNGNYTFYVKAKDQAGNEDLTPASQAFTVNVDTTPPDTSITATPLTLTNSTSASFSFTATKANSTFACKLDAGSFAACTSPQSYSSLTGGSHTFQVQATDQAGNTDPTPASFTWTIDTTAPDTTITASPPAPTNGTSASFSFTATKANSTFACKLDAGSFAACISPQSYSSLTAGSHTFQVQATDQAGNTDPTPASFTWTIDITAPDTSITSAPIGIITVNNVTFNWSGSDNVTPLANLVYAYRLDPIEPTFSAFGSVTTKSYSNLANGNYTFYVKAKDQTGNEDLTPASQTFTINVPTSSNPTITLSFDGQVRDRVGQGELALAPDGKLDGVFTVTLNPGSGNRTVTWLHLTNAPGGIWNTQLPDGFWSLGVSNGLDASLLNAANDSVSFSVTEGSSFKIFASDFQNLMFVNGTVFTLTVTFADGRTATANTTINVATLPMVAVAAATPTAIEGGTSGEFAVTRTGSTTSALTVNYVVGGTGVAGTNYTAISGSVVIPVNSSTAVITVAPVQNNLFEGDKTVVVTLSSNAAYTVGSSSSATVTIIDDDMPLPPPHTLSVGFESVPNSDLHMTFNGLRADPATISLVADTGENFNIPLNQGMELWFAGKPWKKFHVTVFYSDGTTDEADATLP